VRIWTAERPNRVAYQSICYLKEIRKHRARICIARRSSRRTVESDRFFKKFVNRRACICSAGRSDQFGSMCQKIRESPIENLYCRSVFYIESYSVFPTIYLISLVTSVLFLVYRVSSLRISWFVQDNDTFFEYQSFEYFRRNVRNARRQIPGDRFVIDVIRFLSQIIN